MSAPAAFASSEWGECIVPAVAPTPALAAEVRRAMGVVPPWLPRVASSPWLARAFAALVGRPVAYMAPELFDLISLVVGQDNSCRYCYGAQRTLLRVLGYSEDYISRLERDFNVVELPAAERAALDFARRLSRADPRATGADFEAVVRAGLDRRAVVEVAVSAVANTFANRVATLLALPPETRLEAMVDRPLFRVVRPLLAWRLRARRRSPEPPPPERPPCAPVVAALGDSPAAGVLRRTIDEAWASEVLPRRTKTLLLAVVGKALGCAASQAEARELLDGEGFLPEAVDEVLANLASPRLDALEARLVPFARETVRYQTGPIQRRFREVSAGLTPEQILETVGMLALANAVCRLSVVLEAC